MRTSLKRGLIGLGLLGITGTAAAAGYASGTKAHALSPVVTGLESFAEHHRMPTAGYDLTFYPGFASRISVQDAAGSATELYRQERGYVLPAGATTPAARHAVQLMGGSFHRDVAISIHDPRHEVARVILELYAPGEKGGAVAETLVIENDARFCPPHC